MHENKLKEPDIILIFQMTHNKHLYGLFLKKKITKWDQ